MAVNVKNVKLRKSKTQLCLEKGKLLLCRVEEKVGKETEGTWVYSQYSLKVM